MALLHGLPLFQLGQVLYPTERMPLHVFEPRYKAMVRDCLRDEKPFGIILFTEGHMATIGCIAGIQRVLNQYDDGRMDILVEGEKRFRVESLLPEDVYLAADVEELTEKKELIQNELRERLITQHIKLVELAERTLHPNQYQDVERLSFFIAHNAGLTLEQKQEVLELNSENERIAYLVEHLESFIPRVEQVEVIRRKVRSNGHLRDFPPKE